MRLLQSKMIELKGVEVAYDNYIALENANLTVDEGDFMAITGPNGGGKTTLLKVILGLVKPTMGEVIFRKGQQTVDKLDIGYLPQKNMIDSKFPITVEEVVTSGLLGKKPLFSKFTSKDREKVEQTLELVGMTEKRKSAIGELSGGQLQRTLFGRAVISRPSVLVLDEPLSYIDKSFEKHFYDIIADYSKQATIILVSHEMTMISQMATRHIIVDKTLHDCKAAHHFMRTECE